MIWGEDINRRDQDNCPLQGDVGWQLQELLHLLNFGETIIGFLVQGLAE
jgi:hypothetical protein